MVSRLTITLNSLCSAVKLSGEDFKGYLIQAITRSGEVIGSFSGGNTINCGARRVSSR